MKLTKPILFGVCGAVGCLLASFGGELFLAVTKRPPSQVTSPQAVVLLIDTSSSMAGDKINEVKAAATEFVNRQNNTQHQLAVYDFSSQAEKIVGLSSDKNELTTAIASLVEGGGTRMDLGIEAAVAELESSPLNRNILLFTDGIPNEPNLAYIAASLARQKNINLIAVATGDADTGFLATLTGDPNLVFFANSGEFNQAFAKAEAAIYSKQLIEGSEASGDYGIIFGTLRIGTWTAILAIGISLALIVGQNRYLRRRLLSPDEAKMGIIGSIAAGMVAGSLGQLVYIPLASVPILSLGGNLLGWAILGTLLGGGMSAFVANLPKNRALAAGAIGGVVGGVSFLIITGVGGAIAGRIIGSAIIGFFIGATIALVEIFSKQARLIVQWTPTEQREILLGDRPIVLGSSYEADIYLRQDQGYLPITAKIFKEQDTVFMEFMPEYAEKKGIKISRAELSEGTKRKLGDVTLTVKNDIVK